MPILTVKRRYLALIRSGEKTSTIRLTCKVQPGDVLTFTDYRDSVRTRCQSVERLRVQDLTDAHARADGFDTRVDLLAALHAHYPDLSPKAGVWVVRFVLEGDPFPLFTHSGSKART